MSFAIFSDSSCNLPKAQLEEFQVQIISSSYEREGKLITCPPYPEDFDGHEYYNFLRNKGVVKTSLIPAAQMEDAFRPVLAAGEDVLYITLSSGISGTVASGLQAAQALMEEFPQRQVRVLDSMGAGFGIGLLLGRASDDRKAGLNLDQTYASLERDRDNLCEFFTVDDLMFLRRTGRLSGVTATLGTMLQLKPLLRGDETGHHRLQQGAWPEAGGGDPGGAVPEAGMQPGDPAGLHLPRGLPGGCGAAGSDGPGNCTAQGTHCLPPRASHWRSRGSWNASALLPWEGPITRHRAAYGLRRAFKRIVQNGAPQSSCRFAVPRYFLLRTPGRDLT